MFDPIRPDTSRHSRWRENDPDAGIPDSPSDWLLGKHPSGWHWDVEGADYPSDDKYDETADRMRVKHPGKAHLDWQWRRKWSVMVPVTLKGFRDYGDEWLPAGMPVWLTVSAWKSCGPVHRRPDCEMMKSTRIECVSGGPVVKRGAAGEYTRTAVVGPGGRVREKLVCRVCGHPAALADADAAEAAALARYSRETAG